MAVASSVTASPSITPIPIPAADLARARSALLVGGSFDPPHLGHTRVPCALRASAFPDGPCASPAWLIYIPAARSPLKTAGPVASDADRVRMLELATASVPHTCVWTDEIDRAAAAERVAEGQPPPSFTVDTVRRARAWLDQHAPNVALRLVIGADQAAEFHRWREPMEIIRLAEPLVMGRKGVGQAEQILRGIHDSGFWSPEEMARWRSRVHDLRDQGVQVSSTQIRRMLATGSDTSSLLEPAVGAYIASRNLYRAG